MTEPFILPNAADLLRASNDVLLAQRALAEAQERKHAALVAIHKGGVAKRRVSQRAREFLLRVGITPEEIRLLGLSPASVRLVLAPARTLPPATTPEQR